MQYSNIWYTPALDIQGHIQIKSAEIPRVSSCAALLQAVKTLALLLALSACELNEKNKLRAVFNTCKSVFYQFCLFLQ